MKEMSKSISRRQRDPNFVTRYFRGSGIDIGGFPDPFSLYREFFPLVSNIRVWDLNDGDAQRMGGALDETYDFVVSSHCLEHLHNPIEGLENWFRILKPGGHLIVTVPEEDLYEQGTWPSNKNLDHKWTFTIWKSSSWSPNSINILDILQSLGDAADIRSIRVEDSGYRYSLGNFDQTLTPTSESAIEFIVRKKHAKEIIAKTSAYAGSNQIEHDLVPYMHQYEADYSALKQFARSTEPFQNFEIF